MTAWPPPWLALVVVAAIPASCNRDAAQDRGGATPISPPETIDRAAGDAGPPTAATPAGDPEDTTPAMEKHVVRVDVESVSDLKRAADEHRALARGDENARLEIVLAPGEYDEPALSLSDPPGRRGRVEVVLRGAGGGASVLRRPRVRISGSRVQARDLVIHKAPRDRIALELAATEEILVDGLAFVDTTFRDLSGRGARRRNGVLVLQPTAEGATAILRETWFARGRPGERTGLVSVLGGAPRFAEVSFSRVGFAGISGGPAVSAHAPAKLTFSQSPLLGDGGDGFLKLYGEDLEVTPPDWGKHSTPIADDALDRIAQAALRGEKPAPPDGW